MDIVTKDLEPGQAPPKFKESNQYDSHYEIDIISRGKLIPCYEYYAQTPNSWSLYALTSLGDWLSYYDPNIVEPPEEVMYSLNFLTGKYSVSTGYTYAVHTITSLFGQQQIQENIKNSVVIDLGSGSGIQALASLRLGAKHVIIFEHDDEAIKMAEKLLSMNGFEQQKYTIIADSLQNAAKYLPIISQADIGIANIGSWVEYDDAHLKAVEAIRLAPHMKYYIAGGYGYGYSGNINEREWKVPNEAARGEIEAMNKLSQNRFNVISKVDGHIQGLMNCSRTLITQRN